MLNISASCETPRATPNALEASAKSKPDWKQNQKQNRKRKIGVMFIDNINKNCTIGAGTLKFPMNIGLSLSIFSFK